MFGIDTKEKEKKRKILRKGSVWVGVTKSFKLLLIHADQNIFVDRSETGTFSCKLTVKVLSVEWMALKINQIC